MVHNKKGTTCEFIDMKRLLITLLTVSLTLCGCGRSTSSASVYDAVDDNYRNYYEIFVYSFCDSDGDGIGDLKGVESKLDYIADLGCNGIWLMPVCPSPTYHKYDVTDYKSIDPVYGTIDDLESLINAAHEKHINIIVDMVINHTSSKHPWFIEATDYLRGLNVGEEPDSAICPYVDYYHFSKEKKDNTWYQIDGTEYYYEGSFWSEMPDLNLSDQRLMNEIKDIMSFWMDKGVDGFRMDAPLHYEETDTGFNTSVLNELYNYCRDIDPDIYMVSEIWASEQVIEEYYGSNTPSMFDFTFAQAEGNIIKTAKGSEKAERFVDRMVEYEAGRKKQNPEYINAPFITNHDMPRVANALNGNTGKMKMAAALLLSMNGSPFIYYGEELGMSSSGTKDENKRLAMYWSDTDAEGMCAGPEDADKDIVQKCAPSDIQCKDETSLYCLYKKALDIRNNNPEIARGDSLIIDGLTSDDIAVILRTWKDRTIYIIYNTAEKTDNVSFKDQVTDARGLQIKGTVSADGTDSEINDGIVTVPGHSVTYVGR